MLTTQIYEPATVEELFALVSLANGVNSNMLGNHEIL